MLLELIYKELPFGITCIDTQLHRPGMVACYLIQQGSMAGFVDTGVSNNVPMLLEILRKKRIAVENVAYIMPTHVHLDHAGGAGELLKKLPNARLLVHPAGARHLIDPSRLQAGSMAVYGQARYESIFGELIPTPADRVDIVEDGFELDFNGRKLVFYDTPGHARHHYCIYDERSKGLFTGDTFGASYPLLNNGRKPFIFPPTTPIQFDPVAWKQTLNRLMSLKPQRIFVTHFGMHDGVELLALMLKQAISEYVAIAEDCCDNPDPLASIADAIMRFSCNSLLDNSCGLSAQEIKPILEMDMALNAQGLVHWLTNRDRTSA